MYVLAFFCAPKNVGRYLYMHCVNICANNFFKNLQDLYTRREQQRPVCGGS